LGETAGDLNADRNEGFPRTFASTIVQELRFADGLVVRLIAVHQPGTEFNRKQLVDILNFAREPRLYQLKLQAHRNPMELVMPSEPEDIDLEIEEYCDDLPEPSVSDTLVLGPDCYRLFSFEEMDHGAFDELRLFLSVDTKYTVSTVEGLISAHWSTISERLMNAADERAWCRLQDVLDETKYLLSQYIIVPGTPHEASLMDGICVESEPQDATPFIPYSSLGP
jgi:hypothetical protein